MQNESEEAQQTIDRLAGEIKEKSKEVTSMEAKVDNTVELRRQLMNDRNKEMNNMDLEDFDAIKHGSDNVSEFFRTSFTSFLENSETAKYNAGAKCWGDMRNFQIALRSAAANKLSKGHLDEMMKKFGGGENPEKKGEFDPKGGEIFVKVTKTNSDGTAPVENLPYYSFFRVLSKQWHFASMARKEERLSKKADNFRKEMNRLNIEKESFDGKQQLMLEMINDLDSEITDIQGGMLAFCEGQASL
jgi:cytochrome c556